MFIKIQVNRLFIILFLQTSFENKTPRFVSLVHVLAQSAGAVEYTDCTSAEGQGPTNECPGYDTKQSDVEVPVIPGLWGIRSTPSFLLLPGPLCPVY